MLHVFTNVNKKYTYTYKNTGESWLLCKSSLNSKLAFLKSYLSSCYQNKELNCSNNWAEKVNSIGLEWQMSLEIEQQELLVTQKKIQGQEIWITIFKNLKLF